MAQYLLPETAPNATGQLFHLGNDPGETTNLFFEESRKRQELQTLLSNLKSSGRSAPKGRKPIGIENIPLVVSKTENRKDKREIIPVVDISSTRTPALNATNLDNRGRTRCKNSSRHKPLT